MRTAVLVVAALVLALVGVVRVGRWAAAEAPAPPRSAALDARPPAVPAPGPTTATSWTTPAFVQGPVVTFPASASQPVPSPTTAVGAPAAVAPATAPATSGRTWTWDQLADCETGLWGPGKVPVPGTASWSATRGVYQGGLQFDARTWDAYRVGRPGLPADAQLATREQQIEVAERVLHDQGAKAWPTCGPRIGMTGTAATSSTLPVAGPPENEPD